MYLCDLSLPSSVGLGIHTNTASLSCLNMLFLSCLAWLQSLSFFLIRHTYSVSLLL